MRKIRKIGIDPGLAGALVAIEDGKVIEWESMPVIAKTHGKGKQVDAYEVERFIFTVAGRANHMRVAKAYVERVSARPGNGVSGMFAFGHCVGVIEGVLATFDIPIHWVLPTRWKRAAGLLRAEKDAARLLVRDRHPELREALKHKNSVGIADAVLIAEHGD